MNTAATISIACALFLLALASTLWLAMGSTIFAAFAEFGQLICG